MGEKLGRKKRNVLWLSIAVFLCLVSMIFSNAFQTVFGQVKVKSLMFESITGHHISAKLFIPDSATKENPAPAVVIAHGWYNNKGNQDLFTTEFSRRGYVVLAYDMYSHGNSENLDNIEVWDGGNGMYDAVAYVSGLPYVDASQIAVTGHSAGSNACSKAVVIDNEKGTNLINTVLLNSYDPVLADATDDYKNTYAVLEPEAGIEIQYNNIYGSRDVALLAGRYDDYFYTVKNAAGKPLTATRDYINTRLASAFLAFGDGPDGFEGTPVAGEVYTREIDGKVARRAIYTPSTIHTLGYYTSEAGAMLIGFLNDSIPAPIQLEDTNMIWVGKQIFGLIGYLAFFMLLAMVPVVLVQNTRLFASLGTEQPVPLRNMLDRKGIFWTLGSTLVRVAASALVIFPIMGSTMYSRIDPVWRQKQPFCISVWALTNGIVAIALLLVWYFGYAKKRNFSLRDAGMGMNRNKLWKTILLAVIVVWICYGVAYFADFFFQTDFRIWQWAANVFTAEKLPVTIPFLPLFLIFYVANSIAINVQGFNNLFGKKEWVNILVLAVFNILSCAIIIAIQYIAFTSTGLQVWDTGWKARVATWMTTASVVLFLTPFVARKIYKETNNPYLGGVINGMVVTLMVCMNSTTLLGPYA